MQTTITLTTAVLTILTILTVLTILAILTILTKLTATSLEFDRLSLTLAAVMTEVHLLQLLANSLSVSLQQHNFTESSGWF